VELDHLPGKMDLGTKEGETGISSSTEKMEVDLESEQPEKNSAELFQNAETQEVDVDSMDSASSHSKVTLGTHSEDLIEETPPTEEEGREAATLSQQLISIGMNISQDEVNNLSEQDGADLFKSALRILNLLERRRITFLPH
jgi:DNA-binding transcriptional regulator YiaG